MSGAPGPRLAVRAVAMVAGTASVCGLLVQAGFGAFASGAAPHAPLISSAPLRPTISTSATVAFDRVSEITYECSLDRHDYLPCPSPVTYRGLRRGSHLFAVRARTLTGARSDASTYSWTVVALHRRYTQANLRLQPLIATAPVWPWTSRNATFAWLLQHSATSECRLDAGVWARCANPMTYLGLGVGRHVFRVRAKGANGRRSGVNHFVWKIGASAPPAAPTITSRPQEDTTSTDVVFVFDVASGSGSECQLDGGGWQLCSSPAVYVGLDVGAHTFCARATSPAGVTGPATCTTWTVRSPVSPAEPSSPVEPSGAFTISGAVAPSLRPGVGGPLPLAVSNPFDFDLTVTGLTVTVLPGSSRPGCDGPANLQVTQSNMATGSVTVVVPAYGSVTLPAQGATAPQVTMLDLPTNQDACKNAMFSFSLSGTGTRS